MPIYEAAEACKYTAADVGLACARTGRAYYVLQPRRHAPFPPLMSRRYAGHFRPTAFTLRVSQERCLRHGHRRQQRRHSSASRAGQFVEVPETASPQLRKHRWSGRLRAAGGRAKRGISLAARRYYAQHMRRRARRTAFTMSPRRHSRCTRHATTMMRR